MVYVGRGLDTDRLARVENCLIDPSLPVAKGQADSGGEYMPYWPSYSDISPSSRLAYLQWLASGRSSPDVSIGYVFLYFYGLERRLLLDRPSEDECRALIAEVERLRGIYGSSRSFKRYSEALLGAAEVLRPEGAITRPNSEALLNRTDWEPPLSLLLDLGKTILSGRPLDGQQLFCWWLADPDTRFRTPARRAFQEFEMLFQSRFAREHPNGLSIKTPKSRLKHVYRSASGSFERNFADELNWCSDVSRLKKPLKTAAEIAETCMNDLDSYSRYLGRKPEGRDTIEAHALLPAELAAMLPNTELQALGAWVDRCIADADGLVPVEQVLERLEGEQPLKVGKRSLVGAADVLARVGIGLAPDPRFAIRAPKLGEPVVLFELPEETTTLEDVGPGYASAVLSLALGTYIAHADGIVSEIERERLAAQIDRMEILSKGERARLHANLQWMIAVPPTLAPVRKRLSRLPEEQKHELGRIAIAIAGADGVVDPAEVDALLKLYRVMGLPQDEIFGDLHAMASAPAEEPVTVLKSSGHSSGYAIPEPKGTGGPGPTGTVQLDLALVQKTMEDTNLVSAVLSEVFVADILEEESEQEADDGDAEATKLDGLDASHRALLEELLTRTSWNAIDFAKLAGHFGLMSDGALETLNEWAFETFDEPLLEEDDELTVSTAIVEFLTYPTRREPDDATQHQTA